LRLLPGWQLCALLSSHSMSRPSLILIFLLLLSGPPGSIRAAGSDVRLEPVAASTARAATAGEMGMLNEVLHRTANDYARWAFTEHRVVKDDKGKVKSELLLRYDPSKPYAEQWMPLAIDGKPPSERDFDKYRRMGERRTPVDVTRPMASGSSKRRPTLGELIDVPRSSIAAETDTHLIFDVALVKQGNERFPPDKFQVLTRIRKEGEVLENISVRLRESFRAKLVVKVKSGEGSLDFAAVDPKYPPALVSITADAAGSILFVNIGRAVVLNRTDQKHVKLYDERFDVQIGSLKAIDF
jgi:hypothetical protein